MAALRIAAKNTTKEAALLMQYIILKGANPCLYIGTHVEQDIWREKGAKQVSKSVGMVCEGI